MKKIFLLLCLCVFFGCSEAPEQDSGPKKHDLQRTEGPTREQITTGQKYYIRYRSVYTCTYCGASAGYIESSTRGTYTQAEYAIIIQPNISSYNLTYNNLKNSNCSKR